MPAAEPGLVRQRVATLIVATNWWPAAARLAMRLLAHGCEVVALCPPGHVIGQLAGVRVLASPRVNLAVLENAIRSSSPTLIIPCDDPAVWQLHQLHRQHPDLRTLITHSLGDSGHYATIRSRARLLEVAAQAGIRVPETRRIASPGDLAGWFHEVPGADVLKVDGTWGGGGISVVRSPDEALAACRRLAFSRWRRWKRRWRERLVDSDPPWDERAFGRREVLLQRYVAGRPANSMLACWRGTLLGVVSVEVLCSEWANGPSMIVRLIDHPEMRRAAEVLCTTLGLSGFHGLDFILEEGNNRAHFIELNPRCTRLGHLRLPGHDDLAATLAKHIGATPPDIDREAVVGQEIVAFFPQALSRNPQGRYLEQSHVDVPWSEPQLIAALLRHPRAPARPLFRLYHAVRRTPKPPLPSVAQLLRVAVETGHSDELARMNFQANLEIG